MRKNCLMVIASCFSFLIAFGQDRQEIKVGEAVEKLRQALISGDRQSLEEITSTRLSYGHSGGLIENREQFIEKLVSGQSDFLNIELTNQTINVNKKLAIVRHQLKASTLDSGKVADINLKVLLVWQKIKNRWKLVARQAVK